MKKRIRELAKGKRNNVEKNFILETLTSDHKTIIKIANLPILGVLSCIFCNNEDKNDAKHLCRLLVDNIIV